MKQPSDEQQRTALEDAPSVTSGGTRRRPEIAEQLGEILDVMVAYRNGAPVRLDELGRVVDGVQTDKVAGWFNEDRAVVLAVQRQPGTNTIEIVDAIKRLLPTLRQQLPAAVSLNVVYDRSVAIRESVHDVQFTLLLTIALVVMVIFLFLRNLSATLIPSLAVPLSIVGTFAIMYALGYSIDIISLMALTLCVGFVVDDAVVMLENIVRHMEMGKPPMQAALDGSKDDAIDAVRKLTNGRGADVVVGPCDDGGFYVIAAGSVYVAETSRSFANPASMVPGCRRMSRMS